MAMPSRTSRQKTLTATRGLERDGAVEISSSLNPASEFRPTPAMRLYLAAEIRFIKQRRCYTQRQIAAEIDVSEEQVSRWHKVRGYDDWRRDALVAEASREWGPMLLSCAQRVKETGDYRGLEVLGEVFGLIDRTTPNASRAPIVPSIVTLIPSPGMDPEPWIRHRIELPESDP